MVPMLQTPLVNKHATLVTLFMNAVDETMTDDDKMSDLNTNNSATKRLVQYLPPKGAPTSTYAPEIIKFSFARDLVSTYYHIFDR